MANVDGDVKIRVSLDSRNVEKGADRVKRKMDSLAKTVAKKFSSAARQQDIEQQIAGYEEQARAVEKTIRAEQERIAILKRLRKEVEYDPKSREMVDQMGITDLDKAIDESYNSIVAARKELKGYNSEVRSCSKSMDEMADSTNPVAAGIKRMGNRMNSLVRRVFIFNIILKALRAMRDGLAGLLSQDKAVMKSMAQIKGSLYAAFMPIYNLALPAIRGLLNFLAQLTSAIAVVVRQITALLGGLFGISTAALKNANALGQQAGATSAAGNAAKKAAKQLAAFDEINQMSEESSSGGGSGGTSGGSAWDFSGLDKVSAGMQRIAKIVLAIGAGIAGWKLATALGALKDAGIIRNLAFIAGAAITIWSIFDLIIPAIKSIIDDGPNIENVLELIGGIFAVLAGVSLMTGDIGGGLIWVALAVAVLAAANWDKIKDKLGEWKRLVEPIVEGFQELAGIIVKIATEGFSLDIVADIGNMSFTSSVLASVVTGKLVATIGKLFNLGGTIGVKAGLIAFALSAAVDVATDAIDIATGNAEDRSEKIKDLITKLLFGAAAALVTVALGGGGWALMVTVPLGIKIASRFLDDETTKEAKAMQDKVFSGGIEEALEATQNLEDIMSVLSSFTGFNVTRGIFENMFTPEVLAEFETGKRSLEEMQYLAADWMYLFYEKSGTNGFDAWLETLGLIGQETTTLEEELADFGQKYKELEQSAQTATTQMEEFSNSVDAGGTGKKYGLVDAVNDMIASSGTLETDLDNVGLSLGNVETAAENVSLVLTEDVSEAISGLQTEASETGTAMSSTFSLAALKIRTSLTSSFKNIFKSFSSGGTIFKGIETGIEKVFKGIVNDLIDGLNNVLTKSFASINSGLLRIKNTNINNSYPFSGLSTITLPKIPKLAEGAVIPANREFLAILGDQKNGTNIEAPLDTIVEAVMIAMARAGMDGGNIAAAVRNAMQGLSFKVGKKEIGHVVADAINTNRRDEGKLALNL